MEATQPDAAWRAEMLAHVRDGELVDATDALLSLTNHEPDRSWIEGVLVEVIDSSLDIQVRQLAVICLGHVARIHRAISKHVVQKLEVLEKVPEFSARAKNALEDVGIFAK